MFSIWMCFYHIENIFFYIMSDNFSFFFCEFLLILTSGWCGVILKDIIFTDRMISCPGAVLIHIRHFLSMKGIFHDTECIVYKNVFIKEILYVIPGIIIIQIGRNIIVILIRLVIKNLIIVQTAEDIFYIRFILKNHPDFLVYRPVCITGKSHFDRMCIK